MNRGLGPPCADAHYARSAHGVRATRYLRRRAAREPRVRRFGLIKYSVCVNGAGDAALPEAASLRGAPIE